MLVGLVPDLVGDGIWAVGETGGVFGEGEGGPDLADAQPLGQPDHVQGGHLAVGQAGGLAHGLLLAVGGVISAATGNAIFLWVFALIGVGTTAYGYWNSDKLVLSMQQARPVDPRSAPELYRMVEELAQRAALAVDNARLYREQTEPVVAWYRDSETPVLAIDAVGSLEEVEASETEKEGAVEDVSDADRTNVLRDGAEHFRTIFEASKLAIVLVDLQGVLIEANRHGTDVALSILAALRVPGSEAGMPSVR